MKRSEAHCSLDGKLRRLLWSMLLLVCVILVATLAILLLHNQQYSLVTANIVRASQFNQNFKEEVDLKMYYYVIDSSYGETLPLQEVGEAKALAQELLSGTQDRQSRKAITSAIDLCENLHERIVQITETDGYEARMELLESNIYILTELIQQYFYTYLYHEAGYLDSLQTALTARLWLELGLVAAGALVLVGVLMRRSAAISRSSGKRSVVSPSSGTVRSKNRQAAANCSRVGSARRASRRETAFPAAHRWASVSASCSRPLAQREGRMSTICSCTARLPRNSLICK